MNEQELVGKMVDPPSGWRWGFPKEFRPNPGQTLKSWMVQEGYPPDQVDFAMGYLRVLDVQDGTDN